VRRFRRDAVETQFFWVAKLKYLALPPAHIFCPLSDPLLYPGSDLYDTTYGGFSIAGTVRVHRRSVFFFDAHGFFVWAPFGRVSSGWPVHFRVLDYGIKWSTRQVRPRFNTAVDHPPRFFAKTFFFVVFFCLFQTLFQALDFAAFLSPFHIHQRMRPK
jgi:hypothetical protein